MESIGLLAASNGAALPEKGLLGTSKRRRWWVVRTVVGSAAIQFRHGT